MEFQPIESKYALLVKYDTRIEIDETARLAGWQDVWNRLVRQARTAGDELSRKQDFLRGELVRNLQAFVGEVRAFRKDFMLNGPVENGIKPLEVGSFCIMLYHLTT
jgi:dynein heavy chain